MLKIISKNPEETLTLGKKLAKHLKKGSIIALFGDLGAGKTVLVKGIAQGLGFNKRFVCSPTFTLIKEYHTRVPLYHLDLYRLSNLKDIYFLGFDEYFYNQGICAIEWADRIEKFLPKNYLRIELEIPDRTKRIIKLISKGKDYQNLLRKIKK